MLARVRVTFFVTLSAAVFHLRWAVCDDASFFAVKRGQYPGWAYKGWMEAWNGEWREPEIEVRFRSSSKNTPQWDDPATMKEMNTRYHLRPTEIIQGQACYLTCKHSTEAHIRETSDSILHHCTVMSSLVGGSVFVMNFLLVGMCVDVRVFEFSLHCVVL